MSKAALTPRRSALPDVPSRPDLEALSPADLWTLEERATEIQGVCRELNDGRLRQWVEEGKTQTEIAKLVGRSQARISQRCSALGIVSGRTNSGEKRASISADTSIADDDDAEEVALIFRQPSPDGEVVDDGEPGPAGGGAS